MVWTLESSRGKESAKIAHLVVPYTRGMCLDVGCGDEKVWPGLIGIDSGRQWGYRPDAVDIPARGEDLGFLADQSVDGVFSSHFLEHTDDWKAVLKEWFRVVRIGGYLTLYWPHPLHYPRIGMPGANVDHRVDLTNEDIIEAMKEIGSWELLENEVRSQENEYSGFLVFRRLKDE